MLQYNNIRFRQFSSIHPPPPHPPLAYRFIKSSQALSTLRYKRLFQGSVFKHMRIAKCCYHKVDRFYKYLEIAWTGRVWRETVADQP